MINNNKGVLTTSLLNTSIRLCPYIVRKSNSVHVYTIYDCKLPIHSQQHSRSGPFQDTKVHYHLMAEHTLMQIASHLNTGHLRSGSKTRHKNSKDLNSGPFEYQTHYNHLNTQLTTLKISFDHTVVHFTCSFFYSITRQTAPSKVQSSHGNTNQSDPRPIIIDIRIPDKSASSIQISTVSIILQYYLVPTKLGDKKELFQNQKIKI